MTYENQPNCVDETPGKIILCLRGIRKKPNTDCFLQKTAQFYASGQASTCMASRHLLGRETMKKPFGIVLLLPCLGLLAGACTGFNHEDRGHCLEYGAEKQKTRWYRDADGDGHGNAAHPIVACTDLRTAPWH